MNDPFLWGVAVGLAIGLMMAGLIALARSSPRCAHDRVQIHSVETYANTAYAHGGCLDCGTAVQFDIGFTAQTPGAQGKAVSSVLTGKGYRHNENSPIANLFERSDAVGSAPQ